MKKLVSFNLLLILSTSTILSSCGGGNAKAKATFSVDAIVEKERPLTAAEINVATRICYAYQSKSQNFRTPEFLASRFVFTTKKTDCQNVSSTQSITTVMNYDSQNNLTYNVAGLFDPNLQFNKKVQTDTSGYLEQLCPKILTNQPVSNTTTQANIIIQISFFSDEMDGFFIQYFNKQLDNSYKIDSAEKFRVPTSETDITSGRIRGMDQFYSTQKICSKFDKNRFSDFEQNFTSR